MYPIPMLPAISQGMSRRVPPQVAAETSAQRMAKPRFNLPNKLGERGGQRVVVNHSFRRRQSQIRQQPTRSYDKKTGAVRFDALHKAEKPEHS